MKRYYLDCNATTPLRSEVRAAMAPYLEGLLGNASSLHAEGRRARAAVDDARDRVAAWLGAQPHEIVFTGGGTESNNLGVQGLALAAAAKSGRRHVVTSAGEHHAVLQAAEALRDRHGFEVTFLPLDAAGRTEAGAVAEALRDDTVLVSVMTANNETGVRQPVPEIARLCAERGVLFHTDAVQSAGKERLEPAARGVSALSLTAHKFGGPVGAGVLYLKSGLPVARLMEGGEHENQRRPGTENVAGIVGLAEAVVRSREDDTALHESQRAWTERLWDGLQALGGVRRNGSARERLPNTLNVSFEGVDGEELLIGLDLEGLAVSSGSACLVGSVQRSHVLRAMGLGEDEIAATVRFSIGEGLEPEDADEVLARVERVVRRLRGAA
ncbi:MAG: cysteine desulfurase family protein [Verrucomicrobiota bacterium]